MWRRFLLKKLLPSDSVQRWRYYHRLGELTSARAERLRLTRASSNKSSPTGRADRSSRANASITRRDLSPSIADTPAPRIFGATKNATRSTMPALSAAPARFAGVVTRIVDALDRCR